MPRLRSVLPRPRSAAARAPVPTPVRETPFGRRVRRRLDRLEGRADRLREGLVRVREAQSVAARRVRVIGRQASRTSAAVERLEARVAALSRLLLALDAGSPSAPRDDMVDVALAGRLDGSVGSPAEAAALGELLVDLGHPLLAERVASSAGALHLLGLRHLRLLASELRLRGFLERATVVLAAAVDAGGDRDRRVHDLRLEEVAVLSGEFAPHVPSFAVTPVPGRVLHVVGYSLPRKQSGYTIRTQYLVQAQAAAGLEPHVVTQVGVEEQPEAATETVAGIPHHRLPGPLRSGVGLASWLQLDTERLAELVVRVRPAVLHAHSDFVNAIAAEAVGQAAGIPVVYEARGFWEETWRSRTANDYGWTSVAAVEAVFGTPEAYRWRREREREARSRADHVVTLARVMARRIEEAGLPADRLSLAPNAVDAEAFGDRARDPGLAEQLGIGERDVVVGYISSLVEYEGIDTLVTAFAGLRASTATPVRLLVVGDGPERERLEALAATCGSEGITFTGRVPHDAVDRYYSLIDVFVVPRRPSDVCHLVTPLKPFEAFASGCTVVMSDVEALCEIAEDCGAATLFGAGDASSLTRVLVELVADPARRTALAEAGRAWVRSNRSWQHNAQVYLEVYERLGVSVPVR